MGTYLWVMKEVTEITISFQKDSTTVIDLFLFLSIFWNPFEKSSKINLFRSILEISEKF